MTNDAGKWGDFSISTPDMDSIDTLLGWIDTFKEMLGVVIALIDKILTLASTSTDATTVLVKQVLEALKGMLEGYLVDAGIYGIYVPFGKRLATQAGTLCDVTPSQASMLFPPDNGLSSPTLSESEKRFLTNANRRSGGNAGYYRIVRDSLQDMGDRSRPQFNTTSDWIGGMNVMVGSTLDPLGILDEVWQLLGLFGSTAQESHVSKVPTAKNLTVEALERPVGLIWNDPEGKGSFRALLKWDGLEFPVKRIPDLWNTVIGPARIAIIMIKNDITVTNSSNIVQIMGTRELKQGDTFGAATVIYEDEFKLDKASHIHTIPDAGIDDTYYFAVAYQNSAWPASKNWTVDPAKALGYWETSNVASVSPWPAMSGSTPPDWWRSPSLAELIPPFAYFMRTVLGWVDSITSRTLASTDFLNNYVKFMQDEIGRYGSLALQISTQVQRLIASLRLPSLEGGIYARLFEGKGGNQFLLSDLASSLTEDFEGAPPFHNGDEFVTGFMLIVGAPTEGELKAKLKLFELIFNIKDEDEFSSDPLADLESTIDDLEKIYLGPALSVIEDVVEEEEVTFDESLDVTKCTLSLAEVDTEFGADFNPLQEV